MRFLFVGLGSIGQRHLKNLGAELTERNISFDVDALRSIGSPLGQDIEALISRVYSDSEELSGIYDSVFITNPTYLHYETLKTVAPFAKAVFIEKPVFIDPNEHLDTLALNDDIVCYVACPLRRSPVIQRIKEILKDTKMFSAHTVCSSYLPDWRKDNYRKGYGAKKKMGGGVRLDLIHEPDYIFDLFGLPEKVMSLSTKVSNLDIDSDDYASFILDYKDKVITLSLDYFGRAPIRKMTILTEDDTIVADILSNTLCYLKSGLVESFDPIDIHREEMRYFLNLLEKKEENINNLERAITTLRYALM